MPAARPAARSSRIAGIGADAVRAATGRDWNQWLKVLDAAGAPDMTHKQIAAWLHEKRKLPGWWAQMITVGYEQARGRRVKHQKTGGFEVGASRMIAAAMKPTFDAWKSPARRARWLPGESISIRKANPGKSIRITWTDNSNVVVNFWNKGASKTQVVVQHGKLPDAKAAARIKKFWGTRLDALREQLEPAASAAGCRTKKK